MGVYSHLFLSCSLLISFENDPDDSSQKQWHRYWWMHRITMGTKHGLSGRFAMNMKTPELIPVLRELTSSLQHYNNNEQWRPPTPQARPAQLDGLFETERERERERETVTWLAFMTASVWGRAVATGGSAGPVSPVMLHCFEWNNWEQPTRRGRTACQESFKLQSNLDWIVQTLK